MSLTPVQQEIVSFDQRTNTETWTQKDETLVRMESLYHEVDHQSKEGVVLCFALAKVYDDLGETEKAFAYLQEGNSNHRIGKIDTVEDARQTAAGVRSIFDSENRSTLVQAPSSRLIFILGLPRSGTTLVEQILASHPDVCGGGEMVMLGQWCMGFLRLIAKEPGTTLSEFYLNDLRRHYQNGLAHLNTGKIVTDKMPLNFFWIGFIRSVFPDAVIVHTIRSPMAVCWSIYKTAFIGTSNGYSCDLHDIGEFYRVYASLMDYWEQKFPRSLYHLNYEALTENQEQQTRSLLEACGLSWHPDCLSFHRNPRDAQTASRYQVRKPMYQGSSESWQRYEKHLGPLKEALGDYALQEGSV